MIARQWWCISHYPFALEHLLGLIRDHSVPTATVWLRLAPLIDRRRRISPIHAIVRYRSLSIAIPHQRICRIIPAVSAGRPLLLHCGSGHHHSQAQGVGCPPQAGAYVGRSHRLDSIEVAFEALHSRGQLRALGSGPASSPPKKCVSKSEGSVRQGRGSNFAFPLFHFQLKALGCNVVSYEDGFAPSDFKERSTRTKPPKDQAPALQCL